MSDFNQMNVGPRWYVARTYSGYENKVKQSLERTIENRGLSDLFFDIRIPTEKIVTKKGDEEVVTEEIIFPCYIYIKMIMTDESWHAVRTITGVTGFVGPGSRPTPLPDSEVEALNIDVVTVQKAFKPGDAVNVVSGLFEGFSGIVQSISEDEKTVIVQVKHGRRDMAVQIDIGALELAEQ